MNCISRLEAATERVKNYGFEIKRMIMNGEGVQFYPTEMESIDNQVCEAIRGLADNYEFLLDGSKFFTSQLYTIYTCIIGKKKRVNPTTKEVRYLYYTDNGVYCSFYNAVKVTKEPIQPICISTHGDLNLAHTISSNQFIFVGVSSHDHSQFKILCICHQLPNPSNSILFIYLIILQ